MSLRTIIVEDEPLSIQYLGNLLTRCPEVELIGKATTEEEAIKMIHSLQPGLVFLDIELHTGTGFEVLTKLQNPDTAIVFTTALDHYAIKMIRLSAVPFLQKPIDAEELGCVIAEVQNDQSGCRQALSMLLETLRNNNMPLHMALKHAGELEYIKLNELVRIESADSETRLFLLEGRIIKSDMSIKDQESLLEDFHFFRVNASHLVNLQEVKEANGNGNITMNDGTIIPLSAKRKDQFLHELSMFTNKSN